KRGIADTAAQGGGGSGEEDVALAARQHQPCGLAAREEAGIAGHFPYFAEHALGRFQDRKIDIGADVEDAHLERRVPVSVVEEGDDLLLLARIQRARMDLSARILHRLHQRRELLAIAAAGEHGKAFSGELLGDLGADIITGADNGRGCVSLGHNVLRWLNNAALLWRQAIFSWAIRDWAS